MFGGKYINSAGCCNFNNKHLEADMQKKMDAVHIQSSCASCYLADLSVVVNSFRLCVSLRLQIV